MTEYTDSTEFMRLIADQKIKPSAIRRYLSRQGIILTASHSTTLANDVYTILLGGKEMTQITQLMASEGNYEKSTLINVQLKVSASPDLDILDYFSDGLNHCRAMFSGDYFVERPVKIDNELSFSMAYKRKLPGKNKLIEEETRHLKITIRKNLGDIRSASIDIRQSSGFDAQKAIDLLSRITDAPETNDADLHHVNLETLTSKNRVSFFDLLADKKYSYWRLKTITSITVKKSMIDEADEESEDIETIDDGDTTGALAGISQAILSGSGLRSNSFVKNCIEQGYVISAMKYRYEYTKDAGEFVVSISSKGKDLRVDIDKSYADDDGRLYVQPFPKSQQDEIIQLFQNTANTLFTQLCEEQAQVHAET